MPGGQAEIPVEDARSDLVRCWLHAYGPGTLSDLRWWTGWTLGVVRRALAQIPTVDVEIETANEGASYQPAIALEDDADEPSRRGGRDPWASLLPALDSTVMGWTAREWFLGPHRRRLFDTNGNAGPTIWWNGHIVGGWAQRRNGEIALHLLEDVGAAGGEAIAAQAERLRAFLGTVRFTPRFRTPLEVELSS